MPLTFFVHGTDSEDFDLLDTRPAAEIEAEFEFEIGKKRKEALLAAIENDEIEVVPKTQQTNKKSDAEITFVKKENLPKKTKVKLIIGNEDDRGFGILIRKATNKVNLVDVKQHLMSQPRKYNNFDVNIYEYTVQTGIEFFDDCDEDDELAVLPQFGNMIVLKCWLKS